MHAWIWATSTYECLICPRVMVHNSWCTPTVFTVITAWVFTRICVIWLRHGAHETETKTKQQQIKNKVILKIIIIIIIILILIGAHIKESWCATTYGIRLQIMMPVLVCGWWQQSFSTFSDDICVHVCVRVCVCVLVTTVIQHIQ